MFRKLKTFDCFGEKIYQCIWKEWQDNQASHVLLFQSKSLLGFHHRRQFMAHQSIICGSKKKKILLSTDNSLDSDGFEAIKVNASLVYIFAIFTIGTILESQLTAYKYYLHISVQ